MSHRRNVHLFDFLEANYKIFIYIFIYHPFGYHFSNWTFTLTRYMEPGV